VWPPDRLYSLLRLASIFVLNTLPLPSSQGTDRIWLLFGSLALLVICILLVAVGWSARTARLGVTWGLAAALGVYSFGALLGAGNIRVAIGQEMWQLIRLPPRPIYF